MKYLILIAVLSAYFVSNDHLGYCLSEKDIEMDHLRTVYNLSNIMKRKCDKNGGISAYDNYVMAHRNFGICLSFLDSLTKWDIQIEGAKPPAEMIDRVNFELRNNCPKSPMLKECVTSFTSAIEGCLEPKEKQTMFAFQQVFESLLDFICHEDSWEHIALFINSGGPECINKSQIASQRRHLGDIFHFIFRNVFPVVARDIPVLKLEKGECTAIKKMHLCVIQALAACSNPNMIDVLVKLLIKLTPCNEFHLYPEMDSGSTTLVSTSLITVASAMLSLLWR
ncbi:hypothetical protein WDU94_009973 [Cyamophila willieti]